MATGTAPGVPDAPTTAPRVVVIPERTASGPRTGREPLPAVSVSRLMWRFFLTGLVGLLALAVVTAVVSRRVGEEQALADAKRTAWLIGAGVVQPAITPGVLRGDRRALDRLGAVVRPQVRGSVVRVKVWDAGGRAVYSDEQRLIGRRFELDPRERAVLDGGPTYAHVSETDQPENMFEGDASLVEVYTRITGPRGEPLLFEGYVTERGIDEGARALWMRFAPVTIGALLLLLLLQLPLAWILARRLRRVQAERERLLSHAIEASDLERRRIAADLHDGVVQDLSGVAFQLAAAERRPSQDAARDRELRTAAVGIRGAIGSLRTLLVEIYPQNLAESGLQGALADLLTGLEGRGIRSTLEVDPAVGEPPQETAMLAYRAAQEAVRNVVAHSGAGRIDVRVLRGRDVLVVEVEDDGRGFDVERVMAAAEPGHVGLRVLADLVGEAGGRVEVASGPGAGTLVRIEVPE